MSSNKQRARGSSQPYVQKIDLGNNRRVRRKPLKLCPECKETSDYIKLFSSKINKIEELVDNFPKTSPRKDTRKYSLFNAKFTLNNIPCELECDLSKFNFENLQKLVIITTQNHNNKYSSSTSSSNDEEI